jgi:serine/threonine-protein kinase
VPRGVGLVEGDSLGDYVLEELLGEGAVGVVFRGRHTRAGTVAAVKVLRPELGRDDRYLRRFRREAEVAARVRHPGLVPVLEVGSHDGREYLVSEYVAGPTLAMRVAERPLAVPELVDLARDLGGALDALAAAGLVHRDVKPANVLVGADGTARLADFGLARGSALTVLTRPGEIVGTVGYIAPELVEGDEATPASDLYALGCVLYECLTGAPPFDSPKLFEVLLGHVHREPAHPATARPDVPRAVGDAVLTALDKDAAGRPASGRVLATLVRVAAASATGGPPRA